MEYPVLLVGNSANPCVKVVERLWVTQRVFEIHAQYSRKCCGERFFLDSQLMRLLLDEVNYLLKSLFGLSLQPQCPLLCNLHPYLSLFEFLRECTSKSLD